MANKPSPDTNPVECIIESAIRLAVSQGWRHVSMHEIADEAALSLVELRQHLPAKNDFPKLLATFVDQQIIDEMSAAESSEPPRERIFDVFMTRFDKLTPYRDGIAAIMCNCLIDPIALAKQLGALRSSMIAMMGVAQISVTGPCGALRLKGALLIYASVFRVWLKDESSDLSKTMVALDKALTQADKIAQHLPA